MLIFMVTELGNKKIEMIIKHYSTYIFVKTVPCNPHPAVTSVHVKCFVHWSLLGAFKIIVEQPEYNQKNHYNNGQYQGQNAVLEKSSFSLLQSLYIVYRQ